VARKLYWIGEKEGDMKLICPECNKQNEMRPDDLMGRFYVCQNCKHIFLWEEARTIEQEAPKNIRTP
jgi:ssDNA-binding Zn-finger/Zn-ribbon topoisomerase 1